jgi:hypothetical protein
LSSVDLIEWNIPASIAPTNLIKMMYRKVTHYDWLIQIRDIIKSGMEDKKIYLDIWVILSLLSLSIKGTLDGKLGALIFSFSNWQN